jgi:hypothetical protein
LLKSRVHRNGRESHDEPSLVQGNVPPSLPHRRVLCQKGLARPVLHGGLTRLGETVN